jgi:hypothetical protein
MYNNNVDRSLVNIDNSHDPSLFTDTTNPRLVNPRVLPEPASNIEAANSYISNLKGGKRKKNISNMYKKMKRTKKNRSRNTKRRFRLTSKRSRMYKKKRTMKGGKLMCKTQTGGMPNYPLGYSQYQNNMPMTQTYALGGKLSASESALANPAPVKVLSNCTNCVDNYSRYTNSGFPSRGWW